ncbi:MAG TPA: MFS transporter [Pirellulales bacterium]|nr:MFS transporter [Pirellulales bacterium]
MAESYADNHDRADRLRERMILATLAAVQFTGIVDFMVIMPLGPQLMRVLAITPAQFGLVVSSYTFAAGVSGLIATSLIDRIGRKKAFLGLYVGFLVGTLLCGLAPTYTTLVAARLATGSFGGILGGMAMAIIGDVFPEERRGRATAALMSAFALASVVGVPFGLYLGIHYGYHAPFLVLAALGLPVLAIAAVTLPPLRDHVAQAAEIHPLASLVKTFAEPNHLNAFALIVTLMLGGFLVSPFVSPYLVSNVGMSESELPIIFVVAGALTLFTAPVVGRLSDRYGKLRLFRILAPMSAAIMVLVTNLPAASWLIAIGATSGLMVVNSGRMIPAMAMVTSSVAPQRRGGFMSANSSVQHMAAGLGAFLAGQIIHESADGRLEHFEIVGVLGAMVTLVSLWLAGRLRPADTSQHISPAQSIAAAAEATCDAGDPILGAEITA